MPGTYEEGLRDGRLLSNEQATQLAHSRLDKHEMRISSLERIAYGILAVIAFVQILPNIMNFVKG